jgi:putative peptide zinc metalloprotease protein
MVTKMQNSIAELSKCIEFNKLSENEYILANRKHMHYLKINEDTYNLLQMVDGKHSTCEIQQLFITKYNKQIEIQHLEYLLFKKLSKYGVLKGSEENVMPYQKPKYLKLSFIIFNERLVSKIVNHFKLLFKPYISILVLFSTISTISLITIINFDSYRIFNLQESILCFFIIKAISTTFHEVGHASAAHFFGAKHGGIGGGFYLFTPVYFADVTDIWRLKKWQRIVVNFSGMYFELIFCAILASISFLLSQELLIITSIVVCFSTLLNINPFLRSDGYWVLSDLMNRPNLSQHSFDKLKDVFKMFVGKRRSWNRTDVFLAIYGIISYVFIGMFLYYVLWKNPNSVLNFPEDAIDFVKGFLNKNKEINLIQYGKLVIPLIFYYLLYTMLKSGIKKLLKEYA